MFGTEAGHEQKVSILSSMEEDAWREYFPVLGWIQGRDRFSVHDSMSAADASDFLDFFTAWDNARHQPDPLGHCPKYFERFEIWQTQEGQPEEFVLVGSNAPASDGSWLESPTREVYTVLARWTGTGELRDIHKLLRRYCRRQKLRAGIFCLAVAAAGVWVFAFAK